MYRRNELIAGMLLGVCGLGACATDRDISLIGVPDSGPLAVSPPCQDVEYDLTPSGVVDQFDGIWTTVSYRHDGYMDAGCSSDGTYELRHYVRIDRGEFEAYERLYSSSAECVQAQFDTGGTVRSSERGTLRGCPEYYETPNLSAVRQVLISTEKEARYLFLRSGTDGDQYEQLSFGKTVTSEPLESPASTTSWVVFRRPAGL